MRTPRSLLLLGALGLAPAACYRAVGPGTDVAGTDAAGEREPLVNQPVGAPCVPARPALTPGGPACSGAGCFDGEEVYLEINSRQCTSERCMVYHWDEPARPDEGGRRAFCTCRCGGDNVPGPLCACGAGLSCTTVFTFGDPDFRGAYCVPAGLVR